MFGGANRDNIVGEFFVCDIAQQKWKKVDTNGFSTPGPLFGHTANVYERRIYIFGGLTQTSEYTFSSQPDSAADDAATGSSKPALPDYSPSMNLRSRLFNARGEESCNDIYVFDVDTQQWAQPAVSGTPPPPRFVHSAAIEDGKLWVFGGCRKTGYEVSLNDIYCFDIETSTWSSPETTGRRPSPRHGHSCVAIGEGKLAFFGGANEDEIINDVITIQRFNDLHIFDTTTLAWTSVSASGSPPFPRSFHSAAVVGESPPLMYIFAGETTLFGTDLTVLDLRKMQWKRPLFDCSFEHELHGATEISGKMAVFGGLSTNVGLLDDFFFLNTVSVQGRNNDYTFKIVLAGDSGVGKSCLMTRFVDDQFSDDHESTIGLDFKTVNTMVEGKIVKLHIWDTAGQERFKSLTSHYYRGADGAVLAYDTCNSGSFEHVRNWNEEIDEANTAGKKIQKLVVGNKIDLVDRREVPTEDGKQLAKKISATFVETSACNSTNVDVAFLNLAQKLVQIRMKDNSSQKQMANSKTSSMALGLGGAKANDQKCCS